MNNKKFNDDLNELVRKIMETLQESQIYKIVYDNLIKFLDELEENVQKVYDKQFFETGDPYTRGVEEGKLIAIRQVRCYIEYIKANSRKELINEEGKPSNNGTL